MPTPGPVAVFTRRYLSLRVPPVGVIPNRPANCGSGLNVMSVPPVLTQLVNRVTCAAVSDISPTTTASYLFSSVAVMAETSSAIKAFHPSALNISTGYRLNGFEEELISNIGPPGPLAGFEAVALAAVVNVHTLSRAMALPATSFILFAPVPPFTVMLYVVPAAKAVDGVIIALFSTEL